MKLYHFTDPNRLEAIKRDGIAYGDVPITMTGGYNAPWLTSDPNPSSQGWSGGGYKTGLRLTVDIPENDPNLAKWTNIIENEIEKAPDVKTKETLQNWYDILDKVGGGGQDNWYVYHGSIPYEWVEKVEEL